MKSPILLRLQFFDLVSFLSYKDEDTKSTIIINEEEVPVPFDMEFNELTVKQVEKLTIKNNYLGEMQHQWPFSP